MKKNKKQKELQVVYKQIEGISKEEIKRRLKSAYDIIFTEVLKKRNKKFMTEENKQFYTAQELADVLRVNIMTIYRHIKAGKLKAYKIGKDFRIDKNEFYNFLNKSKVK